MSPTLKVLDKFLQLPITDQLLLIKASLLLLFLRFLLHFFPVSRCCSLICRFLKSPDSSYADHRVYGQKIIWAVEAAGNYLLRTRCLPKALGVQILLSRKGIGTQLYIGFIHSPGKRSAHAWLKAGDEMLVGNNPLIPFYRIIDLPQTRKRRHTPGSITAH